MIQPLDRNGVPRAQIEGIRIDDPVWQDRWRQHDTYVCVRCGEPGLANPFTNDIMGCLLCGFTTTSIVRHFTQAQKLSEYATA